MTPSELNGIRIYGIMLFMRTNEFDEDTLMHIGDCHNKSVVISLDVKNNSPVFQNTGASELRLDIRRLGPFRMLDFIYPGLQWLLRIRSSGPIVTKCAD